MIAGGSPASHGGSVYASARLSAHQGGAAPAGFSGPSRLGSAPALRSRAIRVINSGSARGGSQVSSALAARPIIGLAPTGLASIVHYL